MLSDSKLRLADVARLWQSRTFTRALALSGFGCLCLLLPGALFGQFFSAEQLNPLKAHQDGIQLYGVSGFTTYLSGVPGYTNGIGSSGYQLSAGGNANLGWNRTGSRTSLSVQYGFMYSGETGTASLRNLSHNLLFGATRRLGYRWDWSFSANTQILNSADLMFSQGVFGQAIDVSAPFSDLAAAVVANRALNNNDIAAILTRSSAAGGPAQSMFFGNRLMNVVAQTHLQYRYSPRLAVHFDGGASRNQPLTGSSGQKSSSGNYLIPSVTIGNVNAGLSYSLSPRTTVSGDLSSQRMFASLNNTYTTTGTVSIGRVMGKRWFGNLHAGVGFITPVNTAYQLPTGPQLIEGGTVGFTTYTQTVMLVVDRTVVDSYAIGASSTLNTSLAWSWKRPGHSWTVLATTGEQRISRMNLPAINAWQASVGFSQRVTREIALTVSYGYLRPSSEPLGSLYMPPTHGIRLMIGWTPGSQTAR
jgi:hypothetical protein